MNGIPTTYRSRLRDLQIQVSEVTVLWIRKMFGGLDYARNFCDGSGVAVQNECYLKGHIIMAESHLNFSCKSRKSYSATRAMPSKLGGGNK